MKADQFKFSSGTRWWTGDGNKVLIIGALLGFAFTAACLIRRRKKGEHKAANPLEPNLNMERYVFDLHMDDGDKQAVVESGGDCYAVTLDGRYIGSMWRDEDRGMQWNTMDEGLTPHLLNIASQLSEAFSRRGFASLLKGAYPEIIRTEWKSSETMVVVIFKDADLDVFVTFLKDEVLNLVDFEEHLDLMVKKEDDAYFLMVGIN